MNIEEFRDAKLIHDGFYPADVKEKEFDYCIPLCKSEGYFMEFGVWFGRSLNYMAKNFPQYHFYGFDTFEGIDEQWDTGTKVVDMNRFKISDPENINNDTGLPKVEKNVTLIKGLFQDTLEDWLSTHSDNVSFINVDPDLYSAAIYILETLNERLIPGTIIRFDEICDWKGVSFPGFNRNNHHTISQYTAWREGEWKALNEWIEKYSRKIEPLWRNWHQAGGIRIIQ
jgi:hypothetical protein